MALLGYDAWTLCRARTRGARFDRTLTVGRLNLYLHPAELAALRTRWPGARERSASTLDGYTFGEYADRFFAECLGATSVTALDRSTYQGATRSHDMNDPLPDDLFERFDAVIDAGSLEHVFNVPVALANLMNATAVGGSVFLTVPANNMCGHGFYQFSPELMYRAFSDANGFELRRVAMLEARFPAVESTPLRGVHTAADPAVRGRRLGLRSARPVLLALEAVKTRSQTPFTTMPQQSDYVTRWSASAGQASRARRVFDRLPQFLKARLLGRYHLWEYSFRNRRAYRRLAWERESSE